MFVPIELWRQHLEQFLNVLLHFILLLILARIFHELLSRDYDDGRATWQLVPRYRGIGFCT